MGRRVPVRLSDIAEMANVSVSTVSYVLSGKWKDCRISDATAKRILDLVEQHGCVPNRTARFLKSGRCHLLALVSPHCADFYAEIIEGIEQEGEKRDYQILTGSTFNSIEREESYVKNLVARRVDGVIILPVDAHEDHLRYLSRNHVPTVCFRRRADVSIPFKFMTFNDFEGARIATRHLLDKGCERIAFISASLFLQYDFLRVIHEARTLGYAQALAEADHGAKPRVFPLDEAASDYAETLTGLVRKHRIDGIVGLSDRTCAPVLRVLREAGIRVPEDVRVIGFDNSELAWLSYPPLSSIALPKRELGAAMVQALVRMVEDHEQETDEILLMPRLVERQTSA